MKAPIKSIKHYASHTAATIASGSIGTIDLVKAIAEGAARAGVADVEEGCKVEAVFVEMWISGTTINNTAQWCIVKRPSAVASPTAAEMSTLGAYANKKNILNSGQGIPPSNGNVMNIYKGWIKIPKGKQRFGLKDRLTLLIAAVGTPVIRCGMSTFKEYN